MLFNRERDAQTRKNNRIKVGETCFLLQQTKCGKPIFPCLPHLLRHPDKSVIPLEIPAPAFRYCLKTPVCPGKSPGAGPDRIRIPAKIDGGQDCILQRPGIHEAGKGCMGAFHGIQPGNDTILIKIPEHGMHFIIIT
jgi:hypothetical protein